MTRVEILDAAARIFPRRGYHQASVEEVAEEAGLSTGAVYSNFESKADLFLALYERYMHEHAAELEAMVESGETPEEQIQRAVQHWSEFMHRDRDWFLLDIEFWAYAVRRPELQERYAIARRPVREVSARLIARARTTFGIVHSASPEELATLTNALSMGLMFEQLVRPDRVSDELFGSTLGLILMGEGQSAGGGAAETGGGTAEAGARAASKEKGSPVPRVR